MCGISGFFETGGASLSREVLRRMTDALAHRGPDASGYALAGHGEAPDERRDAAPIGLGHRRLSIIDLSTAANQPFFFNEGRLVVVFNGEIYNYQELRQTYFPHRVALTNGDTEVIGWAYERWGVECFQYFNGFFAIAIYDADRDRLVLGRDRVGKKPLFYWHSGGHFAFGSELKALLPHPDFSPALDESALHEYLMFCYVPGERCIFDGCRKLPAGAWLTLDGRGELKMGRYFDALEVARRAEAPAAPVEELTAHFDELLADAVRLRQIADVPLGAFLSGGIDSSLIVAALARQSARPPRTFTIAFDDPKFNEAHYAAEVARLLGTEHTELTARPADALELLTAMPRLYDEPFADPSALPTTLLSQLTRRHVTVALSGDGGDELFFGYDRYSGALHYTKYGLLPYALRRPIGNFLCRFGTKPTKAGRRFASPDLAGYVLLRANIFNRYEFPGLTGQPFPEDNEISRVLADLAGVPTHRLLRALEVRTYLCDDILQKVDRATMSVALEARAPLLDHRIVEFALGLPKNRVYRLRVRKYLLKKLLYQYLPESLFTRKKKGFSVPLGSWFRGELKPLLDEYLAPGRLAKEGLFQPAYVRHLLDRHMSRRADEAHKIFALLVFQMWRERYFK